MGNQPTAAEQLAQAEQAFHSATARRYGLMKQVEQTDKEIDALSNLITGAELARKIASDEAEAASNDE